MKLTVLVTAKNNAATIRKCLELIIDAPPKNKEVIVVYGKSKDGTKEIIEEFDGIKIFEDNVSTGSAINTGVLNSCGDIIFYVEDHAFVSSDVFLKALRRFEENPDTGYIIFYRYIPNHLKNLTISQKLENLHRMEMRDSTMGQFRAFRRQTFFDVGGFWVFPKGADDFEFATRMYKTKWKMAILASKCWDYPPRRTLPSVVRYYFLTGAYVSCWFHLYYNHPYAKKEYMIKDDFHIVFSILSKELFHRFFYAIPYGIKIAFRRRILSFIPFITLCQWSYVLGFFFGRIKYWEKEKWDGRIVGLR
jgi:glycosyltransferase involved in cell wall biosynthesis